MAWGYWSASTVSDRGKSPKRQSSSLAFYNHHIPISTPAPPSTSYYQHQPLHSTSSFGSIEDDDYHHTSTFYRRPSLGDIEFTGPGSLSLLLNQTVPSSRPRTPPLRHLYAPPTSLSLPDSCGSTMAMRQSMNCFGYQSTPIVQHYPCSVHDPSPSPSISDDEDHVYATGKNTAVIWSRC